MNEISTGDLPSIGLLIISAFHVRLGFNSHDTKMGRGEADIQGGSDGIRNVF